MTPLVERMIDDMAQERGITPEEAEQAFQEEKPMIDIEWFAEPEEVASVAVFLASDATS